MKSLFLLISSTFSIYFFVKFWEIIGLNKAGMELMLLQGKLRPKWKRQGLEPGWSGDQPWPSRIFQKHMAFLIWYLALIFRPDNYPYCEDIWSALTFRSPNMEVLGSVSSTIVLQPITKFPNPWRHHGKFHNPLPQFSVVGEYYFSVLEYFSGPNNNI